MGCGVEDRITELARRQHGLVTRAQLLEVGLLPGAVQRRRLHRMHRGVYLVGPILPPHAREMAAVLACGPEAVVSHRSAAALWGLIAPSEPAAPVDISVPGSAGAERDGIAARRIVSLEAEERAKVHGIPVTAPMRTLADLASVAGAREMEGALARAEREHLVGGAELATLLDRYRGRRGFAVLRSALEAHGGPARTRSAAEARLLDLVRKARLPPPEANVLIEGYEIDLFWRAQKIAVEVDGYRYHGSRPRFESDRRRAAHLAAHGIQLIPLTWRQIVDDAIATVVQLGQALNTKGP